MNSITTDFQDDDDDDDDSDFQPSWVTREASSAPRQDAIKRENYDVFNLSVKPEYILNSRASSLPPLPAVVEYKMDENRNNEKSKRGRNKKRPRDARIDAADKLCLAVIRGEDCPYGAEKCRFGHDLKAYLAKRPEDIKLEGLNKCPHYETIGLCPFGAMCRFGESHINISTGANLRMDPMPEQPKPVLNQLTKDLQTQLRKKTYPFKCKRYKEVKRDEDKKSESEEKKTDSEKDTSTPVAEATEEERKPVDVAFKEKVEVVADFSPLPTKTRKLIDFSNKVYVAPLTTVGNLPFRRVMKKFGADITCGEMAVATNLLEGKPSEWALLKRHPDEDIFGIQLAAGFPDVFTRTMEVVEKYVDVDFVDLNLGCPLDLVCNKGAGAALMQREKLLKTSLIGINSALQKCPVTIKMRTGWDAKKPIAHELVPKILSWGIPCIAAIMVHGRSRLQRYSKEANWEYVNQVACSQTTTQPTIPVIGNGDIMSFLDYETSVEKREGLVNCAMLGRGALIKPWLPTEIKERRHWDISASERLDILKDFVYKGLQHWGSDQKGVNNCRRFLLEWLSFLHRYVPVGMLEQSQPQQMNQRPPKYLCGRSDLETLFLSDHSSDWVKISEMLLGPCPEGFRFEPKHKANSYVST